MYLLLQKLLDDCQNMTVLINKYVFAEKEILQSDSKVETGWCSRRQKAVSRKPIGEFEGKGSLNGIKELKYK